LVQAINPSLVHPDKGSISLRTRNLYPALEFKAATTMLAFTSAHVRARWRPPVSSSPKYQFHSTLSSCRHKTHC